MPPTCRPGFARMRTFEGDALRTVAFPLGGIGTGTVSLGGRGNLRDWEIFNRPAKGSILPYTFFALWARAQGAPPVARVLERQLLPPFDGPSGPPTAWVSGLPRLREARFTGAYPEARIEFEDPDLPLQVSLEALNPFVPMDEEASGLPAAWLEWSLSNPGRVPVVATVCLSLLNPCGLDGTETLGGRHHGSLGRNRNEFVRESGLAGIRMSTERYGADDPRSATLAMATPCEEVTWRARWERAGWWDDVQSFWDDFASDGCLPDGPDPEPSPEGQTDVASLGVRLTVGPGETVRAPFILSWHVPNFVNDWNREEAVRGKRLRPWYAMRWSDAWAVATHLSDHRDALIGQTRLFSDAFFAGTLPEPVLDAVSANASIIRTTTCLRLEDGSFHGFEGCHDHSGCCPMNCTHVWNYEQTVAYLYPALERSVRRTDFAHNTRADGYQAFRTLLPLVGELWAFKPAADGQMGTVMKVYREWQQSGDLEFLGEMWPGVRRALEYAWSPKGWDGDRDGVMEGEQHNTYDIEFYGPNTMMGTFYLGALRAAEEMALALGDVGAATSYRTVFESGRRKLDDLLWNGEYYEQRVIAPGPGGETPGVGAGAPASLQAGDAEPRYQYGPGCLSDHLLGQWFARVVGLGDLLPGDRVRSAIEAIYRHNFRADLSAHHSVQRVYAINDEAGLLLCSWPRGGRPAYPFPYADEVWTGIEYQVAAHLIYEGLVEEGIRVATAARDRHDGAKRNPWNEFECGHHYARAMSSWSLLLALSGCEYSAPARRIAFSPRTRQHAFQCFFAAGTAWGEFCQRIDGGRYTASLRVLWGDITVEALSLPVADGDVTIVGPGPYARATASMGTVRLPQPAALTAGDALEVEGRPLAV